MTEKVASTEVATEAASEVATERVASTEVVTEKAASTEGATVELTEEISEEAVTSPGEVASPEGLTPTHSRNDCLAVLIN